MLGLALGMALKFYISVAKIIKLKVKELLGLIPRFVEVTGEKLVGRPFLASPILNRVETFWNILQLFEIILILLLTTLSINSNYYFVLTLLSLFYLPYQLNSLLALIFLIFFHCTCTSCRTVWYKIGTKTLGPRTWYLLITTRLESVKVRSKNSFKVQT